MPGWLRGLLCRLGIHRAYPIGFYSNRSVRYKCYDCEADDL